MGWELGVEDNSTWLDPRKENFRNFFIDMINDVNENYKNRYEGIFKGIQLGRHFATPMQFGDFSSSMNTFAEQISTTIGRDWFSLSPNPMPQSKDYYNVDWKVWKEKGYHFEIVP